MRFAGCPEVYEALTQHFVTDDMPRPAARHMAAEVMMHGPEADTRIDRFFSLMRSLQEQGYSEEAAQHLAIEAMESDSEGME